MPDQINLSRKTENILNCKNVTITGNDVVLMLLCIVVFSGWNTVSSGHVDPMAILFISLFTLSVTLTGTVISFYCDESLLAITKTFAFRFVIGYLSVTVALIVMFMFFHISLKSAFVVYLLVLAALLFKGKASVAFDGMVDDMPMLLGVSVSLVAASLWCGDSIMPMGSSGGKIVYKPWIDSFTHIANILMLARASDVTALHDIRLSGEITPFYHYASFVIPAILKSFSDTTTALSAFGSFMVPLGYFLTALSAYALVASWWGSWPALASMMALMLLPDAYQQGMTNNYYSYHWLQNIAPGGLYGTALLSFAWLFMIRGCGDGRWPLIVTSYVITMVTILFKAHFFVVNALLLLIYPALFLKGISRPVRWLAVFVLCTVYQSVVYMTRNLDWAPNIVTDGSALPGYLKYVATMFDPGSWLRSCLPDFNAASLPLVAVSGGVMLFVCTFGAYGLPWLGLVLYGNRKGTDSRRMFPVLVVSSFLFMSLFLSLDKGVMGTRDEFLHRPFVWAYYILVIWTFGRIYIMVFDNAPPGGRGRVALAAATILLLFIPFHFGKNVQRGPRINGQFLSNVTLDSGFLQTLHYVKNNSAGNDLIQDSGLDPYCIGTALSERKYYVIKNLVDPNSRVNPLVESRRNDVKKILELGSEREIREFAREKHITWFVMYPGTRTLWPDTLYNHPAFSSGGYRAFKLSAS
jgi:hypothetical protein